MKDSIIILYYQIITQLIILSLPVPFNNHLTDIETNAFIHILNENQLIISNLKFKYISEYKI